MRTQSPSQLARQELIVAHVGFGFLPSEVAEALGISHQRVCQILDAYEARTGERPPRNTLRPTGEAIRAALRHPGISTFVELSKAAGVTELTVSRFLSEFGMREPLARLFRLRRWRSAGEAFWGRVEKTDGCWLWMGTTTTAGYGQWQFAGRRMFAHRLAYELLNGPVPDGMLVCHHCDNPPCVRPDHLFVGTHRDNRIDAVRKGRHRSRASQLTPSEVRQMRELRETGDWSLKQLQERFGVSITTANGIVTRRTWKDVA